MKPPFFACVCLALAPFSAFAENATPSLPPPPAPLIVAPDASNEPEIPIDDLVRMAVATSPRLKVASESLEAARQRALASRAISNPSLQIVPEFTGNREARDEEVILAQPLDLFSLRRARAKVFEAERRRAQAENQLAQRALIVEVRNAATSLFGAQEAEKLEQVQVEIAGLFRDAAARRAQLGDVPAIQVQRAELELLRKQNDLSNARVRRLTRRATLNVLIGQAPEALLRVAIPVDAGAVGLSGGRSQSLLGPASGKAPVAKAGFTAPAASSAEGETFVSNDVSSRPDILEAQAKQEARQAEATALRRERRPAVELQARRSSFFGREGSYAIRAVVTLPLFDFGILKGERKAVEAEARAQQATVRLLRQQADAQVTQARTQFNQSRQNAKRYREQLVPLTLDLLRKTQIGYAQGASTYLEVLDAQRTLRQVQSEYLQALVEVQSGENALDAAINGGPMPPDDSNEIAARGGAQ